LIVEEAEHARRRGARIYAEIKGTVYGDGYHMTPRTRREGGFPSHGGALKDGGIEPEEVDTINAHGTATPANDVAETKPSKHFSS